MDKKEKNEEKIFECLSVTAVHIYPFHESVSVKEGNLLACANIVLNDQLVIRGMRVKAGANGLFVVYPNDPFYQGEETRSTVFPMTRALREHIENCVLEKYMYETEKATVKFKVELKHQQLSGASLQMEIIAASEKEAKSRAKEKAIEIIPSTKDNGDWNILKVEQYQ